jgi:hypothetical protein
VFFTAKHAECAKKNLRDLGDPGGLICIGNKKAVREMDSPLFVQGRKN